MKLFPSELLAKLNEGGILVIPVDESGKNHQIKRIVKKKEDDFFEEIIGRATFVPYIMGERMM